MTLKLSDPELEQLLRGRPRQELRPPADLLARLRADLPAELPGDLPRPEEHRGSSPGRVLPFWRRPVFAVAASLTVILGGSFLALRTFETTTRSPEVQAQVVRDVGISLEPSAARVPAPVPAAEPPPAEERQKGEGAGPETYLDEFAKEVPARTPAPRANAAPNPLAPARPVAPHDIPDALEEKKAAALVVTTSRETSRAPGSSIALPADAEPFSAPRIEEADPFAPAAPLRLEQPATEGNALTEKLVLGDLRSEPELDRLESPTHQGDALRRSGPPPPAPAASLRTREARGGNEGEERWASSWRVIERSLAEGRWPNEREIEDARVPLLNPALPKNKSSADADGEIEPKDPVLRLMMDLLNALGRKELSLGDLHAMRLRAVKLAELRPEDSRVATVLRTLNLAGRLLSD